MNAVTGITQTTNRASDMLLFADWLLASRPHRVPGTAGRLVRGRITSWEISNEEDAFGWDYVGMWFRNCGKRRRISGAAQQFGQLGDHGRGGLRPGILARPARLLPSVRERTRMSARLPSRRGRPSVLAELIRAAPQDARS